MKPAIGRVAQKYEPARYGKKKFRHDPRSLIKGTLLTAEQNGLTCDYDPVGLAAGVPILDVERGGRPVAVDMVMVSLFGKERTVQVSRVMRPEW